MVYTNDGKSYYIEDDRGMEALIEQYMGKDAADWFRETVCEAEYYRDKSLEYEEGDNLEWEENRDMLVDVRDLADELIDMVDGRINKKTMRYKLQRIRDMANNQL